MVSQRSLIAFINFAITLIVSYCLIKYTIIMKENPTCSLVKAQQRDFLYFGGTIMLGGLILNLMFSRRCLGKCK